MRFERHDEPLADTFTYICRIIRHFAYGILIVAVALGIGMLGYHHLEGMSFVDAFLNASMILSDMGPVTILHSEHSKVFAAFYALFSGLLFVSVATIIFAPFVHRFLHKFHLGLHNSTSKDR